MRPTAILLLHCPDKRGIITEITKFITDNNGNIVYLDQYVDRRDGVFFMRLEWELEGFVIPREKLKDYFQTLYATRYGMTFNLYFNDVKPRMAIFVRRVERGDTLYKKQPRGLALRGRPVRHTLSRMVDKQGPL